MIMPISTLRAKAALPTFAFLLALLTTAAQADVKKIEPIDRKLIDANPVVNIYFFGSINQAKVKDLYTTIDEINVQYNDIKKINLYVNSTGGDMDSGFTAYWAVKSSPIPITTINLAVVGSAATMIFCASEDRLSLKGSRFILHPAALVGDGATGYQPNNLARMQQNLQSFNKMFSDIYKSCTTYKDAEIEDILSSEDSRKFMFEDEAKLRGIIKGTTEKLSPAPIVYYITDPPPPAK